MGDPKPFHWDYSQFGKAETQSAQPDETIEMLIVKHNAAVDGFNQWTLNGEAFSMETMRPAYTLHEGRRYRLRFRNASDDIHPLHLHRHSFELTRIAGRPTAGVIKDVVMLGGFQELASTSSPTIPVSPCFIAISNCTWTSGLWRCSNMRERSALEVLRTFFKLGVTSFGGPVAHIGYFREEIVVRRRWVDDAAYTDLVALCQFLPGPASSQVAFRWG